MHTALLDKNCQFTFKCQNESCKQQYVTVKLKTVFFHFKGPNGRPFKAKDLRACDILEPNFCCPYCAAAKALLKTKNVEVEEFDIWKDPAKAKEMLQRTNGARTIPQIFIGETYIGGNDKLQEANRKGELDKLLSE